MYRVVKRFFDILISFVVLVVLLPLLIVIAIMIKIDSKGPIFFVQQRLGMNEKIFNIYKFRSMYSGSEGKGTGLYSYKNDNRITRVGKTIRATSIDELPQLLNILKGDMSIIGPRPVPINHPKELSEMNEVERSRYLVKPGVTGLA